MRDEEKQKSCELFYDDQFRADYIRQYIERRKAEQVSLEIRNFTFADKVMNMEIHALAQKRSPESEREAIDVRVILKGQDMNEVFNENKILKPKEDIVRFRLSFPWLQPGKYYAILEVNEAISGRTTLFFEEIQVN